MRWNKERFNPEPSVGLRSILMSHRSDDIAYQLKPNLRVKFQGRRLRTNSHGMRGPEVPLEKPAGVYRIAMLGDSFPFGWQVEQEQAFPQLLEDILNKKANGTKRIEVLNFAVPGYSPYQEVEDFRERALAFEPDLVLVYFVDNDFGLPFYIRNYENPEKGFVSSQKIGKLQKSKNKLVRDKANLLFGRLDPNKELSSLFQLTNKKKIPLFVAINPRRGWKTDVKMLWVLRQHPEIKALELRHDFMKIIDSEGIDPKALSQPHDAHPSPLMHSIVARIIADGIEGEVVANGG